MHDSIKHDKLLFWTPLRMWNYPSYGQSQKSCTVAAQQTSQKLFLMLSLKFHIHYAAEQLPENRCMTRESLQ